jgi:hypothetical protein
MQFDDRNLDFETVALPRLNRPMAFYNQTSVHSLHCGMHDVRHENECTMQDSGAIDPTKVVRFEKKFRQGQIGQWLQERIVVNDEDLCPIIFKNMARHMHRVGKNTFPLAALDVPIRTVDQAPPPKSCESRIE